MSNYASVSSEWIFSDQSSSNRFLPLTTSLKNATNLFWESRCLTVHDLTTFLKLQIGSNWKVQNVAQGQNQCPSETTLW